jgi:hypothetical protein
MTPAYIRHHITRTHMPLAAQPGRAALDARPQASVGNIPIWQYMGQIVTEPAGMILQQRQHVMISDAHLHDSTQESATADLIRTFSA